MRHTLPERLAIAMVAVMAILLVLYLIGAFV
jgi:hypothetical protein